MRFGNCVVNLYSLLGRFDRLSIELWSVLPKPVIGASQAGIGQRIVRINLDRLLEILDTFEERLRSTCAELLVAAFIKIEKALQIGLVLD